MNYDEFENRSLAAGIEGVSGPIGTGISRNTNLKTRKNAGFKVTTASNTAANVTTQVSAILAGNNRRSYLFIQNLGVQNIFISFGSFPSESVGFPGNILIPPNGFYEPQTNIPVDTIYAVASAGSNLVTIVQGVWKVVYG